MSVDGGAMTACSPYETLVERIRLQINEADIFKSNVEIARAILSEIASAGLQIVPKEPTEEMESAYWTAMGMDRCNPDECLTTLLRAAPDYHGGGKP